MQRKLLDITLPSFAVQKLTPCKKKIFNRNNIFKTMSELNSSNKTPPWRVLPIIERLKDVYFLWYGHYQILPKIHRHSLGQRIDKLFIEIIEVTASAAFLAREEKLPYVRVAIRKTDTLKILLMILWETKSIDNKKYISLSAKLEEIGRMLGGWLGQLKKQNSPKQTGEK